MRTQPVSLRLYVDGVHENVCEGLPEKPSFAVWLALVLLTMDFVVISTVWSHTAICGSYVWKHKPSEALMKYCTYEQ